MAHVQPLTREALPALEQTLANAEAMMGFVPNSMLTMAHMPQLTMAFSLLAGTVFGGDLRASLAALGADPANVPEDPHADEALPPELVQLVAFSVSVASGCRYCQAHTSHNAHRFGASQEKLDAVLDFARADVFSDAERAAIALALAAGEVPNSTTPDHFAALQPHFTSRQQTQLVAVISLFGFLNRWNDTMATQLEEAPTAFAHQALGAGGWSPGKHGAI